MGQGHEDGRQMSVYWWWYSVKKHIWKWKNGGAKEAPNVSTHTNRKWCPPSWPDTRKCQHGSSRSRILLISSEFSAKGMLLIEQAKNKRISHLWRGFRDNFSVRDLRGCVDSRGKGVHTKSWWWVLLQIFLVAASFYSVQTVCCGVTNDALTLGIQLCWYKHCQHHQYVCSCTTKGPANPTAKEIVATMTPFYYLSILSYLLLASDLIFLQLQAYCFSIIMNPLWFLLICICLI